MHSDKTAEWGWMYKRVSSNPWWQCSVWSQDLDVDARQQTVTLVSSGLTEEWTGTKDVETLSILHNSLIVSRELSSCLWHLSCPPSSVFHLTAKSTTCQNPCFFSTVYSSSATCLLHLITGILYYNFDIFEKLTLNKTDFKTRTYRERIFQTVHFLLLHFVDPFQANISYIFSCNGIT